MFLASLLVFLAMLLLSGKFRRNLVKQIKRWERHPDIKSPLFGILVNVCEAARAVCDMYHPSPHRPGIGQASRRLFPV